MGDIPQAPAASAPAARARPFGGGARGEVRAWPIREMRIPGLSFGNGPASVWLHATHGQFELVSPGVFEWPCTSTGGLGTAITCTPTRTHARAHAAQVPLLYKAQPEGSSGAHLDIARSR